MTTANNLVRLITSATILQNSIKAIYAYDPARVAALLDELDLMLLNRKTPMWRNAEIRTYLRTILDSLNREPTVTA